MKSAPGAVIGVAIGSKGAVALIDAAGEPLEVFDMPTLRDGPARRPNVMRRCSPRSSRSHK